MNVCVRDEKMKRLLSEALHRQRKVAEFHLDKSEGTVSKEQIKAFTAGVTDAGRTLDPGESFTQTLLSNCLNDCILDITNCLNDKPTQCVTV